MANGDYCTIGELKVRLWPTGTTPDTEEDTILQGVISSVSRWIDNYTGTRFYTTTSDETRYFTADDEEMLFVPDIVSITTLATDSAGARTYGNTWTVNTDFSVQPYNYSLDSTPIRIIERAPMGNYSFPTEKKSIKIVGKFGYCTAANQPAPVKQACLLQCTRIFKRKDAPFGMIANQLGTMSVIAELDTDIKQILDMYRRFV